MSGYFGGYLGDYFEGYLDELVTSFFQDPVMPSQEPPSDAKSEAVDVPPDDTEDTDGSKTLLLMTLLEQCHAFDAKLSQVIIAQRKNQRATSN